jgi:hypothetical protein
MRILAWGAMLVALLAILPGPAAAQRDFAAILVGTWEGELAASGGRDRDPLGRTLVIEEAEMRDGRVTVKARYGITGRRLGPTAVTAELSDGAVFLGFTTGANSSVKFKLEGDRRLIGPLLTSGRGNFSERTLKLEKVK